MTERLPAAGESPDPSELGRRGARSGLTVVVSSWIQLAVVMAATMTLARLLTPADFGVLAMAIVVVGLVDSFRDFGLSSALVQQERLLPGQAEALFRLSFKLNLALAAGALGLSVVAAWFFDEHRVVFVVAAITMAMFLRGITTVHVGLLQRELKFGRLAAVGIASEVAAATLGIGLALAGAGYWALAIQQVVALTSSAALTWLVSGWRPRLGAAAAADIGSMRRYGAHTTLVRAANHLTESFDRMLVGRLWGAGALGLYQAGRRWSDLAPLQIVVPMKPVAVAVLSRLRADGAAYRAAASDLFEVALLPTLAILAFLVADASDVVVLLLGDQWLDAIPAFRYLGAAAFVAVMGRQMTWIYLAEGRTGRRVRWLLMSRPVYLVAVALGASWGSVGIAIAVAVAHALVAVPGVAFALAGSSLRARDYWSAWWRPAVSAVSAGAVVHLARRHLVPDAAVALRVLAHGGVFVFAYGATWGVVPGGWPRVRDLLRRARKALGQGAAS